MQTTDRKIRVASIQMALACPRDADAFFARLAEWVRVAAGYGADFVCFPEHFTLQLLANTPAMIAADDTVEALTAHTARLQETVAALAHDHAINIVAGSHATRTADGKSRNITYLAHRDGSVSAQEKLHPTPDERDVWNLTGGASIDAIETDCGPVGITICYDSEFPELGRRLVDQGVGLVFVPYCTDTRHGHLRVTRCCQARAIENQTYMVTAGLVGTIANVANLEIAYAQSGIYTPCDHGFARDGVAALAEPQVEQMVFADLDMALLKRARETGSVRNLADRRSDLYQVNWKAGA